jgi:hypothetical protein
MRFTALLPPPPTPTTFKRAKLSMSISNSNTYVSPFTGHHEYIQYPITSHSASAKIHGAAAQDQLLKPISFHFLFYYITNPAKSNDLFEKSSIAATRC